MFRVGLCGGVASGKTTISRIFESIGVTVVDTDIISHQLMQPGQSAYQKTLDHYGHQILLADASLNRKLLREMVFNDSKQKLWLEEMLHPLIRETAEQLMDHAEHTPYVLLVVPLMFETGFDQLVQHVIAIDCPRQVQLARLTQRDGISQALAESMLDAQMDNDQRIALADSVITNAGNSPPDDDVLNLHQKLLLMSDKF